MSAYAMPQADFRRFTVMWNQRQGQTTPVIHFRMIGWLEDVWKLKKTRLLLQAFRSSGKSTIIGLFAAWLLYRNPDLRILVLAADFILARKMVRNVKNILERHPLTTHLRPKKPEQWAGDRFTVERNLELRDPSVMGKGITSNITGSRADVVICDDVEVPKTCDSAEKREALRERLGEIQFVLVPGGMQLYIGTPHSYYSIYADTPRKELGEEWPFLDGFERLVVPVLNEREESAWPEKFSAETIAHMRRMSGPNKFAAQMMLVPVNTAEGRLDISLLRFYDDELDYAKELQTLFLGGKKMSSAAAFWDPAIGSRRGDSSVLAVVFIDEDGHYYLHRMLYLKVKKQDGIDPATAQCKMVAGVAKELMLPSVSVESNGVGGLLPGLLRNEMANSRVLAGVIDVHNSESKTMRILNAFDAILAAERLSVHKSVLRTPFITEMQEWRPFVEKQRDDGVDAVAGALLMRPVKLPRLYRPPGSYEWTTGMTAGKAKTEFDV